MNLDFGVFDSFSDPEWVVEDRAGLYDRHIDMARLADRIGYTHFFFIEHQNPPVACVTSPATFLAALASATTRLRIGAMVFQVPMYNPIRLAQDTAMVDHLSRGRLEFGIGYGVIANEFSPWGLEFRDRRAMGVEAVEILRRAWSGGELTYAGKFWQFQGATPDARPYQKPHPPLWMGGHSRDSIDYAVAENLNLAQSHGSEGDMATRFAYFRTAVAKQRQPGPAPRALLVREVHVAETDEQARREAEAYLLEGLLGRFGVERAAAIRPEELSPERAQNLEICVKTAQSYEYWIDGGHAFVGSPETVIDRIRAQQKLVGYDVLLTHHTINSMPPELVMKSIRLFGERVIPAFGHPGVRLIA